MKITCDQCELTTINGLVCHETGCPNAHKRWIDGEWVKMLTCPVCGYEYPEGETCCDESGILDEDWDNA